MCFKNKERKEGRKKKRPASDAQNQIIISNIISKMFNS